jgi:hypothetical protein
MTETSQPPPSAQGMDFRRCGLVVAFDPLLHGPLQYIQIRWGGAGAFACLLV